MFHGWLIIFLIFSSLQNARDSNKETERLEKLSAWKRINLKNILFLHSRVRLDVLFNIPYDTVTKPLKLALTLILYLFSSILIFENKGKYYSCLLHVFNFKTRRETKEQFQPPKIVVRKSGVDPPPSPTTPTYYRQFLNLYKSCLLCGSNINFQRLS